MIEYVVGAVLGIALGVMIGRLVARRGEDAERKRIQSETEEKLERSRKEAETSVRGEVASLTAKVEGEAAKRRAELRQREQQLRQREVAIEGKDEQFSKRETLVSRREKDLIRREKKLSRQEEELAAQIAEARAQLEAAAGMSPEDAKRQLIEEVREEARQASIDEIRMIEQEAKALADERARMIVSAAVQRYASEHVADRTVCTVPLPSEDLKGRIIGREGRNIRAFEAATGCDLIIDDAPEAVVISSFNPVRREIARLTMERLLADGRIHPARIEEVVTRARSEMEQIIRRYGDEAALELEITGLPPEILKTLGRLHFITSFAQNVLRHSIEVGFLAGLMAAEFGQSVSQARRAGLLHDLGKAVDHEAEGDHAEVGAALLRKHGESKAVVQAVAAHHDPEQQKTLLAQLVAVANTLSASRPGARRETLAAFIKRHEALEALVSGMEGVEQCYAIQAGREIHVIVDNAKLSDRAAELLSRDIARRIETELNPGGEIKVTVIRTTRAVQYAR